MQHPTLPSPSPVRGYRLLVLAISCAIAALPGILSGCRKEATPPAPAGSSPSPELEPLVFPAPPDSGSPVPEALPDTLGWGAAREALSKTLDFDTALTLFNRYKAAALASGNPDEWYGKFVVAVRVLGSESKAKLAKAWVTEALESEDPRLRALVSRHLPELSGHSSPTFYLHQRKLRPGDGLEVTGYSYGERRPGRMEMRLERARLDSSLQPRGFDRIEDTSVPVTRDSWRYHRALDSTGIYRVVLHGPDYFQEQYFQVSHLDMIVKTDGSRLLVWGSSYQDKLPPPYTVFFWNGKSGQVRARSDAQGLAVFALRGERDGITPELGVAIRSGNDLVFSEAAIPGTDSEPDRVGAIYTDRPIYRPGHKVHFRGLMHGLDGRQRLVKTSVDSVHVLIQDPRYESYYDRVLPVDAWGHFGDSLGLEATVRQGRYFFQVYEGFTDGQRISLSVQGGGFEVEAYKKPEFELAVTPVKPDYVLGDTVRMRAVGKYFFGRPLAGAPVRIRWYRSEMYPYYSFRGGKARFEFWPAGGREFLRQDSLNLDGKGEAQFAFHPELTQPYSYLIAEISAVDASRREVRAEAKVRLAKYRTFLQVNFDNYQYRLGDTAEAIILAADLEGGALAGDLSLRVKKDKAIIHEERMAMPSSGRMTWRYAPPEKGEYLLEATLTGPDPKPVYQEANFQVVAAEEEAWQWERIEFQADKERYRPGDTARVTVQLGADAVPALLTAEGNLLHDYRVRRIQGRKLEYVLPLHADLGRNVHLMVAYSGKTGMALGYHGLTVVDSSVLLRAELQGPRTLKPGEAYRGSLRIRDAQGHPVQARFSVALVDEAIFALAARSRPDRGGFGQWGGGGEEEEGDHPGLLTLFRSYHPNRVHSGIDRILAEDLWRLRDARLDEVLGNAPSPRKSKAAERMNSGFQDAASPQFALAASGAVDDLEARAAGSRGLAVAAEAAAPAPPPPRERKEFRDLGYWLPAMETDGQGRGDLAFTLPDDLTRWRLLLRGNDGSSHLLDFRDSLIARQDLMVKLEAPRTLVVGDSLKAASVLHNYSDRTLAARVRFAIAPKEGEARLLASGDSSVTLAPGATLRIDWPLLATRAGAVELSASVQSGSEGDAERRTYPVRERGMPEALSVAGQWKGGEGPSVHALRFPDSALASSRRLEISLSPSLAWSMFQSLEYLTGYPYGCVEQTMSRFLPNLYVASALRRLGRKDDSLFRKLPDYMRAGLDRLAAMRGDGGGWGWWEGGEGTPQMTALVVFGLEFALTQDLPGDIQGRARQLLEPGRKALEGMLKGMKPSDDYAFALHALSQAGNSGARAEGSGDLGGRLLKLVENRGKLSAYGLALLLESLHRQGLHAEKRKVLELLATQRVETGAEVHWPGREGYGWFSQDVETTAQVLRALAVADPGHAWADRIIPYLSRQKHRGYWVSTKTTASVIYALVPYLEKSRELDPDYALTVVVNGKAVLEKALTRDDLSRGPLRIELGAGQVRPENRLEIRAKGKGKLYYQADLKWVLQRDSIAAKDQGLRLRRSYSRLLYTQDRKGGWQVKRVPLEGALKSGDEVEVSLNLTARSAYENLILEDFFPTGMEVVRKPEEFLRAWCGWWYRGYDHEEARDDRMVWFLDRVHDGERTFSYILRAETPGTFIALPARSELMYYPEISGHSGSDRFRIED